MLVINQKPELFTTPRAVASRKKGKVYFDYLQIVERKDNRGAICSARVSGRSGLDAARLVGSEAGSGAGTVQHP